MLPSCRYKRGTVIGTDVGLMLLPHFTSVSSAVPFLLQDSSQDLTWHFFKKLAYLFEREWGAW